MSWVVELLFERYHAAGLGRFRIWVTKDPRPVVARETPTEIERLLVMAAEKRTPAQIDQLRQYHLTVAPSWPRSTRPSSNFRRSCPGITRPWS